MKRKVNVGASDASIAAGPLVKCYAQVSKAIGDERCDDIILNLHLADLVRRHGSKRVDEKISYVMTSLRGLEKVLDRQRKKRNAS